MRLAEGAENQPCGRWRLAQEPAACAGCGNGEASSKLSSGIASSRQVLVSGQCGMEAAVEAAPALALDATGRPQRMPAMAKAKKKRHADSDDSLYRPPGAQTVDVHASAAQPDGPPPAEGGTEVVVRPAPKPRRRRPKQAYDSEDEAPRKRARAGCQKPRARASGARRPKPPAAGKLLPGAAAAAADDAAQASGGSSFAVNLSSTSEEEEAALLGQHARGAGSGQPTTAAAAAAHASAEDAQAGLRAVRPPAHGEVLHAAASVAHAAEATWPLQGYSGTLQARAIRG